MLPTSKEIAMQIAAMHEIYPKYTISELAAHLMYSPVFVINALDEGERMGLFTREKNEDRLIMATPIDYSMIMGIEFGKENIRIQNEILRVITSANRDQQDVESGTLDVWLMGIKPSETELALHIMQEIGFIKKYELKDPRDKKSVYSFYTLSIHDGKKWGRKQFKDMPDEKK